MPKTATIPVRPSRTADSRTCNPATVSSEQLRASSHQHIDDVRRALLFFRNHLAEAGFNHDHDKISDLESFHRDFQTGFARTDWWDRHRAISRHHLAAPDGVPPDVNLLDVLEFIADCVMAGMARSGYVYPLELPDELLQTAFKNTVALLQGAVVLQSDND